VRLLCWALLILGASSAGALQAGSLVVCADPANLPFSNRARAGFENKVVELIAKDLHATVNYLWWAQRRGYVRSTLNEAKCDLWPGVAAGVSMVASTRPYYRSSYMFVTRAAAHLEGLTLDDARLKSLAIGVQMVGNDATNTPPAHAIASRGIIENVRGFMLYGDESGSDQRSKIMAAVAHGGVDVALVWGPLAGYYAASSKVALRAEPVTPAAEAPWPMAYDISVGVRKGNLALLARINAVLMQEKPAIDALLRAYHVPLLSVSAK
jgi:mxaJ protein